MLESRLLRSVQSWSKILAVSSLPVPSKGGLMAAPTVGLQPTKGTHGKVRGLTQTGRSTQFEGRFGRMFRTLPPAAFTEDDVATLLKLGQLMTADPDDPPTPET